MRRPLALLAVLLMTAGISAALGAPAQAVSPVTGRLVDAYNGDAPVAGATVVLRRYVSATTAGSVVGDVQTIPAFARGVAVDAATSAPLAGVTASARDILDRTVVLASTTTDSSGAFYLSGIRVEEIALRFNGAAVAYETGFGGCSHQVLPTFGEACTFGTGRLGKFLLDHT